MTMKAWRLDRLGGDLRLENVPMPEVRPGSILVRVEASKLMSYIKPYVEGRLPLYHAPSGGFTPGGNCVGTIETAGRDVWQLAPGQRVLVSSLFRSSENVADPAQILIGVTSFGPDSEKVQADWPDGTLAEYVSGVVGCPRRRFRGHGSDTTCGGQPLRHPLWRTGPRQARGRRNAS
jgi:alcohol dehydrogenase